MDNTKYFNFYEVTVQVSSDCLEILDRIERDFSYFLVSPTISSLIYLEAFQTDKQDISLDGRAKRIRYFDCEIFDNGRHRINKYDDGALVFVDFVKESFQIYSNDLNRLHELTYLYIQSRVGKNLDLKGLHRLHSFGFSFQEKVLLGSFHSGGGKSTTLLSFLLNEKIELMSDDTVLVGKDGKAYSFPLRIGIDTSHPLKEKIKGKTIPYEIERKKYGKKLLIPINELDISILKKVSKKQILLFGGYKKNSYFRIEEISKGRGLFYLFDSLIIGRGVAMVMESFWEFGLTDFFKKTSIFFSRVKAAINLLMRSKVYLVQLGDDIDYNREQLKKFLRENA